MTRPHREPLTLTGLLAVFGVAISIVIAVAIISAVMLIAWRLVR